MVKTMKNRPTNAGGFGEHDTAGVDFKTSQHCKEAANRARRVLFQMRRGFAVLTPEIFRPLYLALVRPILEYGLQASPPYLRRDIYLMERLPRLGTRMVNSLRGLSYEDRFRRLNLFTIERRLLRGGPHSGLQPISRSPERAFGTSRVTTFSSATAASYWQGGTQPARYDFVIIATSCR